MGIPNLKCFSEILSEIFWLKIYGKYRVFKFSDLGSSNVFLKKTIVYNIIRETSYFTIQSHKIHSYVMLKELNIINYS